MNENKQIDILNIDIKIRERFNKEFSEIDTHKLKLSELKKSIEDNSIAKKIKKKISEIL